jgi:hypothetical protein
MLIVCPEIKYKVIIVNELFSVHTVRLTLTPGPSHRESSPTHRGLSNPPFFITSRERSTAWLRPHPPNVPADNAFESEAGVTRVPRATQTLAAPRLAWTLATRSL